MPRARKHHEVLRLGLNIYKNHIYKLIRRGSDHFGVLITSVEMLRSVSTHLIKTPLLVKTLFHRF